MRKEKNSVHMNKRVYSKLKNTTNNSRAG